MGLGGRTSYRSNSQVQGDVVDVLLYGSATASRLLAVILDYTGYMGIFPLPEYWLPQPYRTRHLTSNEVKNLSQKGVNNSCYTLMNDVVSMIAWISLCSII